MMIRGAATHLLSGCEAEQVFTTRHCGDSTGMLKPTVTFNGGHLQSKNIYNIYNIFINIITYKKNPFVPCEVYRTLC